MTYTGLAGETLPILQFFLTAFYQALHLPDRLAEGMSLHCMFMWLFMLNGLLYVLYRQRLGCLLDLLKVFRFSL